MKVENDVLKFGPQFYHYRFGSMAFYRWTSIGLIILVLVIDVTRQEIHRTKPAHQKFAAIKSGREDYVAAAAESDKSFEVMSEFNWEIWTYSVIAASLVGLSGIFPLLVIPMEAGPALKHGGKNNGETKILLQVSAFVKFWVGYETQGPSSRAESRARIFEFPIFSKLRSGLCFYISLRIK